MLEFVTIKVSMSSKRLLQRGFTVVELLIVVVVIAILAAITVVVFSGVQRRANESASASGVSTAAKKVEVYKGINGIYPAALANADFSPTGGTSYQYSVDGTFVNYCVTATTNNVSMYGNNVTPAPQKGGCPGHSVDGVAPIKNYVVNPSVEGAGLWSSSPAAGYSYAVSTSRAHTGTRSYAATAPASGSALDSFVALSIPVPAAGTYTVSVYVYLTASGATSGNRDFTGYSGNGGGWVIGTYNRSLLNQWQRVQITLSPVAAATMNIRVYPPIGGTMYVDSMMVSTAASNYADGNTNGWVWDGAPHNSTSTGLPQ